MSTPSSYVRRRAFNKVHVNSWLIYLEKDGFVKCSFKNCNFMAQDVDEMGKHYAYCCGENKGASFTCSFCGGCTDSEEKLHHHLARAHNVSIQSQPQPDSSPLQNESIYKKKDPESSFKPTRVTQVAWECFFEKNLYVKCNKCNYLANSVTDMTRHYAICKQEMELLVYICEICKGRTLDVKSLIEHLDICHTIVKIQTQFNLITKPMIQFWKTEITRQGYTSCLHLKGGERDCFYIDTDVKGIIEHSQTCKGPQFHSIKLQCVQCKVWSDSETKLRHHICSSLVKIIQEPVRISVTNSKPQFAQISEESQIKIEYSNMPKFTSSLSHDNITIAPVKKNSLMESRNSGFNSATSTPNTNARKYKETLFTKKNALNKNSLELMNNFDLVTSQIPKLLLKRPIPFSKCLISSDSKIHSIIDHEGAVSKSLHLRLEESQVEFKSDDIHSTDKTKLEGSNFDYVSKQDMKDVSLFEDFKDNVECEWKIERCLTELKKEPKLEKLLEVSLFKDEPSSDEDNVILECPSHEELAQEKFALTFNREGVKSYSRKSKRTIMSDKSLVNVINPIVKHLSLNSEQKKTNISITSNGLNFEKTANTFENCVETYNDLPELKTKSSEKSDKLLMIDSHDTHQEISEENIGNTEKATSNTFVDSREQILPISDKITQSGVQSFNNISVENKSAVLDHRKSQTPNELISKDKSNIGKVLFFYNHICLSKKKTKSDKPKKPSECSQITDKGSLCSFDSTNIRSAKKSENEIGLSEKNVEKIKLTEKPENPLSLGDIDELKDSKTEMNNSTATDYSLDESNIVLGEISSQLSSSVKLISNADEEDIAGNNLKDIKNLYTINEENLSSSDVSNSKIINPNHLEKNQGQKNNNFIRNDNEEGSKALKVNTFAKSSIDQIGSKTTERGRKEIENNFSLCSTKQLEDVKNLGISNLKVPNRVGSNLSEDKLSTIILQELHVSNINVSCVENKEESKSFEEKEVALSCDETNPTLTNKNEKMHCCKHKGHPEQRISNLVDQKEETLQFYQKELNTNKYSENTSCYKDICSSNTNLMDITPLISKKQDLVVKQSQSSKSNLIEKFPSNVETLVQNFEKENVSLIEHVDDSDQFKKKEFASLPTNNGGDFKCLEHELKLHSDEKEDESRSISPISFCHEDDISEEEDEYRKLSSNKEENKSPVPVLDIHSQTESLIGSSLKDSHDIPDIDQQFQNKGVNSIVNNSRNIKDENEISRLDESNSKDEIETNTNVQQNKRSFNSSDDLSIKENKHNFTVPISLEEKNVKIMEPFEQEKKQLSSKSIFNGSTNKINFRETFFKGKSLNVFPFTPNPEKEIEVSIYSDEIEIIIKSVPPFKQSLRQTIKSFECSGQSSEDDTTTHTSTCKSIEIFNDFNLSNNDKSQKEIKVSSISGNNAESSKNDLTDKPTDTLMFGEVKKRGRPQKKKSPSDMQTESKYFSSSSGQNMNYCNLSVSNLDSVEQNNKNKKMEVDFNTDTANERFDSTLLPEENEGLILTHDSTVEPIITVSTPKVKKRGRPLKRKSDNNPLKASENSSPFSTGNLSEACALKVSLVNENSKQNFETDLNPKKENKTLDCSLIPEENESKSLRSENIVESVELDLPAKVKRRGRPPKKKLDSFQTASELSCPTPTEKNKDVVSQNSAMNESAVDSSNGMDPDHKLDTEFMTEIKDKDHDSPHLLKEKIEISGDCTDVVKETECILPIQTKKRGRPRKKEAELLVVTQDKGKPKESTQTFDDESDTPLISRIENHNTSISKEDRSSFAHGRTKSRKRKVSSICKNNEQGAKKQKLSLSSDEENNHVQKLESNSLSKNKPELQEGQSHKIAKTLKHDEGHDLDALPLSHRTVLFGRTKRNSRKLKPTSDSEEQYSRYSSSSSPRTISSKKSKPRAIKDEDVDEYEELSPETQRRYTLFDNSTYFSSSWKLTDQVVCGVCKESMTYKNYRDHAITSHYMLCWIEGEPPVDMNDPKNVVNRLWFSKKFMGKSAFKCPLCKITKLSAVGYQSHILFCGKKDEEKDSLLYTCELCGSKMVPASKQSHIYLKHSPASSVFDTDPLIIPKAKRAAAHRAEEVIQASTANIEDESQKEGYKIPSEIKTMYKNPARLVPKNLQEKWMSSLQATDSAACGNTNCDFTSNVYLHLRRHFYSDCPFTPAQYREFQCKNCEFSSLNEMEMAKHVQDSHQEQVNPESSDESSDYSDDDDSSHRKRGNKPYSPGTSVSLPFKFLKVGSRPRWGKDKKNGFVYSESYRWTENMRQENLVDEQVLFVDLQPSVEVLRVLEGDETAKYLPQLQTSAHFCGKDNMFQTLGRFQATLLDGVPIMFTGGPVWAAAWAPVPDSETKQFLAVATLPSTQLSHQLATVYSYNSLIQIWAFDQLSNRDDAECLPRLVLGLGHGRGAVWKLRWCPSGCYQDSRLGLLAAACSDGTIPIYAVPKHCSTSSIIHLATPVMELRLGCEMLSQCRSLDWHSVAPHNLIVGGFANGLVALWDLSTTSPLLKDGRIIYPFKVLEAHQSSVSAVSLSPVEEEEAYMMTASLDRSTKFWRLDDLSAPMTAARKAGVLDAALPSHWITSISAYDEVYNMHSSHVTGNNCRDAFWTNNNNLLLQTGSIWSLSFNDYLNACACASEAGKLTVLFRHQILVQEEHKKVQKTSKVGDIINCTLVPLNLKSSGDLYKTYTDCSSKLGIKFAFKQDTLEANKSSNEGSFDKYPLASFNHVTWNQNKDSFTWLCASMQSGLVVLPKLRCISKTTLDHLTSSS